MTSSSSQKENSRHFGTKENPVVIAHRGGSLEAPENTIEALRHAREAGSDWQEIDVGLSKDGQPVVIHDETLERTTPATGDVDHLTLAQLEALTADRPQPSEDTRAAMAKFDVSVPTAFPAQFTHARVPSFKRVLSEPGLKLMVELKASRDPERLSYEVIRCIREAKAETHVVIGSFSLEALVAAHRMAPELALVAIADDMSDLAAFKTLPLRVGAVRTDLVAEARVVLGADIPIWAWTCYSVAHAHAVNQAGAAGLITDVPAAVVKSQRG